MYRGERLVIRLSKSERDALNRLAKVERLPVATLARQLLLKEADSRPDVRAQAQGEPQEATAHV